MLKYKISNNLHLAFLKFKNAALVVFLLSVSLIFLNSNIVYGQSVVAEVRTPITLTVDDKTMKFVATQNTVLGAVLQSGVKLNINDITIPTEDTLLTGQGVNISITRALPVLISDGNQEHIATSAYSNPTEILNQLKVVVYPEDKISAELILDPVDESTVGQKISIERSPVFTVHVDGEDKIIRSWGKTIGEVLDGKVSLGQRDIVEPALVSQPTNGEITITRVNVAEVEQVVSIPFETAVQNDYSLYVGQTKTLQSGVNGQKKQLVRVTYHNGAEIDRTILSSEVTAQPVTNKILKGFKPYNAGAWWDTLVAAGAKWGVSPTDMLKVMSCESGGRPDAGWYYKGLFQYSPDTWSGASSVYPGGTYKGALITNGTAQIYVTAWKVSRSGWSAWSCKP